jgi:flagellar hook-associated protein 1 FlgK
MTNILNIGKTALAAAQAGISTTGHNIANASTPGYSRQTIVQSTSIALNYGYGYVGQGTQVSSITRIYSNLLAQQVNGHQATSSELSTYATQMGQIDDLLANSDAGLSPAIQEFFNSIQDLASSPSDTATRQSFISMANALASRFQSMGDRLAEMQTGVNSQLTASVTAINSYSTQIAQLNTAIEKAVNTTGQPPNDLMDQRDYLVAEMNKEIKVNVVTQGNSYNVYMSNGLPLVSGPNTYTLAATRSPTDSSRVELAYQTSSTTSSLMSSRNIEGGNLGGILKFRASLDDAQNRLGQIAVALASSLNNQNAQGLDSNGDQGGNIFNLPSPVSTPNSGNAGNAIINTTITDASAVMASGYKLQYDGVNYTLTRGSDGQTFTYATLPQSVDGLQISLGSGTMATGDSFQIEPTKYASTSISVAITDVKKIAAGAPVIGSAATGTNTGSASIGNATVSSTYAASPWGSGLTLTYNSGTSSLNGFPASEPVTVTVNGTTTTYPAGSTIPFTSGATYAVAGVSFQISGAPANGDSFTLTPNTSTAAGDNRNALLMAGLQTAGSINGSISYESAFAQLVSSVGNKTRELQITSKASSELVAQSIEAQQSMSGVNLDEEATNLLRYQQAYQAAGKMMQIASTLFDTILAI